MSVILFADRKKKRPPINPAVSSISAVACENGLPTWSRLAMDASILSSNWKKLQATLKQSAAAKGTSTVKRKAADRDSGAVSAKKRKFVEKDQSKTRTSLTTFRKREMLDRPVTAAPAGTDAGSTTTRRRSSTATSAPPVTVSRNAKENEGRSPT